MEKRNRQQKLGLVQPWWVPSATHCWAFGVGLSDLGNIQEKNLLKTSCR